MSRVRVFEVLDEFPEVVLQPELERHCQRRHVRVVTMISGEAVGQTPGNARERVEPRAHVQANMAIVDHSLIEAEHIEHRLPRHQHEIVDHVETQVRTRRGRDLVEMKRRAQLAAYA